MKLTNDEITLHATKSSFEKQFKKFDVLSIEEG
jgi:hypothetical protein